MTTATPTLAETDLDTLAQRVDTAFNEVNKLDGPARTKALDLKRAVEEFHKVGLTHIVKRLKDDPRGKELLFELVDEPAVYALFAMHGIVRADVTTQASRVLEMVRPYLQSHGGDVALVKVEGDTAFVRLQGACNGCSLAAVTLRDGVAEALTSQIPQIQHVEVVANEPGAGMIMLNTIPVNGSQSGWVKGPAVDEVVVGRPYAFSTDAADILLVNLNNQFFAYRNECSHQALPLENGLLDADACILTCPWHGFKYDLISGECLSAPQAQLEPFPLRIQEGYVWVRPG
ncbi:MAG: NifU family protein [Anaerolineae bacterium]|nr:NifU family protein [Anaerolineae bacterium]